MDSSFVNLLSNNGYQKVRKMLANSYLRDGRYAEALKVYHDIVQDSPDDGEVLAVIANLYLAAGSSMTAFCLFKRILEHEPENRTVEGQYAAAGRQHSGTIEEIDPLAADALARLASRMDEIRDPNRIEELRSAADMIERSRPEDPSDGDISAMHENMHQLMPALIEINIRAARAAGHLELAESLRSLQISLTHQTESQWKDER